MGSGPLGLAQVPAQWQLSSGFYPPSNRPGQPLLKGGALTYLR